jgi:hypothetical protein
MHPHCTCAQKIFCLKSHHITCSIMGSVALSQADQKFIKGGEGSRVFQNLGVRVSHRFLDALISHNCKPSSILMTASSCMLEGMISGLPL